MELPEIQQQRRDSASMIEAFCRDEAVKLGIDLAEVVFAEDYVSSNSPTQIITIVAAIEPGEDEPQTAQVEVSAEELEDYQGRVGTEKTDRKLRQALQSITPFPS